MGKIFKCDIDDCPEWDRCLDKDRNATRCAVYRMMKKNLPVHNYDKQVVLVNGVRYESKREAANAAGMRVSDMKERLERSGSGRHGSMFYFQPSKE